MQDQNNTDVRVDAHTRKANPRRSDEDEQRRIFRRGYPLILPDAGTDHRGLVFICFGRTISTQFEFIMRAWMKNKDFPQPDAGVDRLLQFEHVLTGGYYFVPPLRYKTESWSWMLPPTA